MLKLRVVKEEIRVVPGNIDETKDKLIKLKEKLSIPPRSEAVRLGIRGNVEIRSDIIIEPTIQLDEILAARIVTTG